MTFIIVVYGDNKQRLFNPYCSALILLESIRKHCCADNQNATILDLTDAVGNVKHLSDNLTAYANTYLDERTTYWLIKVEKGQTDEDPKRYTLLTNNSDKLYPDLSQRLEELSRPPSRATLTSGRQSWANVRKKLPRALKGSKRSSTSKKNDDVLVLSDTTDSIFLSTQFCIRVL